MEQQQRSEARVSILWRGKEYVVEIPSDITLKDFGIELQKMTNIKADTMRLIVPQSSEKSSKLLSPFSEEHSTLSLQETSILHAKTIRMMGALVVEVDEVVKNAKANQRIAGFDEEENRIRQRISNRTHNSIKLPQGKYIFSQFRTLQLPGIELNPPPSEALKRMHMLAADPGIVAIMNKHHWRVGIMTELAPLGYVGVSPTCILGFNKNQGQEISLRLRTDDLKGFRKYESIKKTLLHELAHMIYSEHDAKFYALDKQLNQEAASLDWTKSGGHTLSGFRDSNRYEEDFDIVESSRLSHKLGGNSPHEFANARESSVAAAYGRVSNESTNNSKASKVHEEPDPVEISELLEQEKLMIEDLHRAQLDGNNESDHHESRNQNLDEPDPDEYEGGESMDSETFLETNGIKITSEPFDDVEMIQVVGPKMKEDSAPHENNLEIKTSQSGAYTEPDPDESQTIDNVHGEPDPDDEEMRRIQDPVTVLCNRIRNVINTLQSEVNPTQTTTVLQTLFKIIRNVIEHPNEMKFKRLRKVAEVICDKKANPVIQRNVANYKAAMEFLFLIGFNEDVVHNEIGQAETYFVLKRNDPGLLWLAKSSLETCIA